MWPLVSSSHEQSRLREGEVSPKGCTARVAAQLGLVKGKGKRTDVNCAPTKGPAYAGDCSQVLAAFAQTTGPRFRDKTLRSKSESYTLAQLHSALARVIPSCLTLAFSI